MKLTICNVNIELKTELCEQYKQKILYDITPEECRMYAEAHFEKDFTDIINLYPIESIVAAIENAMKEEINL